jgi:hypothetical protein
MNDNEFLFSVPAFGKAHTISRTQVYREIGSGRLKASKIGKRTVITAESAAAWRAALPDFRKAA